MAMDYYCNTKEDIESRGPGRAVNCMLLFQCFYLTNIITSSASKSPSAILRNSRRTSKKKQLTAQRDLRKLIHFADRYMRVWLAKKLCGVKEKLLFYC